MQKNLENNCANREKKKLFSLALFYENESVLSQNVLSLTIT